MWQNREKVEIRKTDMLQNLVAPSDFHILLTVYYPIPLSCWKKNWL